MLDQFHRYVFPGQHPYELVVGGQSYSVSICYKDHCVPLGSSGAIRTSVENGGFTTINQTVPSHVLYDGKVIRHLYQGEDGAWYVSSYGFGNNKSYTIPVQYGQLEPEYVQMNLASVNQWAGPGIFNNADQQMLMNIETHH
jgi:hypothetical protein